MNMRMHLLQGALLGVVLSLSEPALAAAGSVYKCVDSEARTTYQTDPCETSASETRMDIAAAVADAPVRAAPPRAPDATPALVERANAPATVAPSRRTPFPWSHRTLAVGMSDDEVLNLPGWGRPSRVMRARMPHEWHEEWVYRAASAAEERHLHFVNMRLVSVDVAPGGEPPLQITSP